MEGNKKAQMESDDECEIKLHRKRENKTENTPRIGRDALLGLEETDFGYIDSLLQLVQ